jgi:sugar-specific transcriptional regulator TrmB
MLNLDLTPFGFTSTESRAYVDLVAHGPSSGYAVARRLDIARANSYQALRGLVAKKAAEVAESEPQVFRASQPKTLLARIARHEAEQLDVLEQQIDTLGSEGAPGTVEFTGERELYGIALRTVLRADRVHLIGPPSVLSSLLPIWRKRAADGRETLVWSVGAAPQKLPVEVAGTISPEALRARAQDLAMMLLSDGVVGLGRTEAGTLTGLWSSDPIIVGAAEAALGGILTAVG